MKKMFLTFLSLAAILLPNALRAQTPTTTAAASADAPGLLYKISGQNLAKPSYLFGTIHIICPNDMFSMEKIGAYLDQTDQLLMELDMDDPAEMMLMGQGLAMPNGKTLSDLLTPEQYAKVDEMFKNNFGASVEQFKTFKPFMLQVIIATNPKTLGCNPPGSYEASFLKAATGKKKPIVGLETVTSQFEFLSKKPLEKQAQELYEMARDPEKAFAQFRKLLEAYKAQNSDSLYDVMSQQMSADKEFQTVMLDDRNKTWIPNIEKAIKEKPSFIAVGGGHLGGVNGVISLLRAKGYKVEAIKL